MNIDKIKVSVISKKYTNRNDTNNIKYSRGFRTKKNRQGQVKKKKKTVKKPKLLIYRHDSIAIYYDCRASADYCDQYVYRSHDWL